MDPIDVRHPGLPGLFDATTPNVPMVFGVLEGRLPGRAFADDPSAPTVAVVQDRQGITFLSAQATADDVAAALLAVRADGMAGLAWRASERAGLEPEAPAKTVERLEFGPIDPADPRFATLRDALPAGVVVEPMNSTILERCEWRELVVAAYGTPEAFLAVGHALVLMEDGEIVAEAYAPFIGGGIAEIGVVTAEAQRGRGLAAIACAFLAAALADAGLAMTWSCDADNGPSIRVAEKLGFGTSRPYALMLYRPNPA